MKNKNKKWYLLSPEDYDKVFDYLSAKYPKLFIKDEVFVLKKGLHQDIFNSGELEFSKTVIRKFLKLYTEQKKYRELHIENTPRYDLDGKEVDFVTKEDIAGHAKKKKEIKNQLALKKNKNMEQKKKDDVSNKEYKLDNLSNKQEDKLKTMSANNNKPKLGLNLKLDG